MAASRTSAWVVRVAVAVLPLVAIAAVWYFADLTLRTHAFRSALIVHLLPFGSFTAVNLLGGSLRMPLGAFLLGTGLGLLPGVAFFTLVAGRLPDVVCEPTALNIALLAGAVVLVFGLTWGLRRWAKRHEHRDAAA